LDLDLDLDLHRRRHSGASIDCRGIAVDSERQTIEGALAETLGKARFAYVFGSFLSDAFGGESDVDLAVDLGEPLGWEARASLVESLSAAAGRNVDLVDLHTADPVIRMQVLRYGRLLVENDRSARHRFEARALGEYLDLKLDRAPVEHAMVGPHAGRR